MGWVKIKKTSFSSNEPVISIRNNSFSYNVIFSRIADLKKNKFVTYYLDEENRKIGFEFKAIEDDYSFKVIINEKKGNYSRSTELFSKKWIQKVSKLNELNRFKPIKDGNIYVITLMPAFEHEVKRENYLKIPQSACGIYRYLDGGNIVYIGKGNIRDRFKETTRKEWGFDTIQYSLIEDSNLQHEWESFWIERFKAENEDKLPAYNLISGKAIMNKAVNT